MTTFWNAEKCLYEILGIQITIPAEEIRSAYRKLALKFHPDKVLHSGFSQEEATEQFREILGAYEVLSNPHKRSLYDILNHPSSCICSASPSGSSSYSSVKESGSSSSAKKSGSSSYYSAKRYGSSSYSGAKKSCSASSAKKCTFDINFRPFFSSSVYAGYGDTLKGFYKVYGDLFQTLSQQEMKYAYCMGAGPIPDAAPVLGNLQTHYAQVCAFYNYWLGFSTVKDFSWVGVSKLSSGRNPNRKTKRSIEKEDKKFRNKV